MSVHMAIFLVAMCTGWLSTNTATIEPREGVSFWLDASRILSGNLGAVAVLVVSNLSTAGVGGLAFFVLNGYMVGRLLSGFPADLLPCFILFAPLEVASFSGAAAATCNLSLSVAQWLRTANATMISIAIRPAVDLTAIAVVGLVAAAFIESWVIQLWR